MNFTQVSISIAMLVLAAISFGEGYKSNRHLPKSLGRSDVMECYNNYMQHTTALSLNIKKKHETCNKQSEEEKSALVKSASQTRQNINFACSDTCNTLNSCDGLPPKDALKCLTHLAGKSVNMMYNVNINATQQLTNLTEGLLSIDTDKQKCVEQITTEMREKTERVSSLLSECIMGNDVNWNDFQ